MNDDNRLPLVKGAAEQSEAEGLHQLTERMREPISKIHLREAIIVEGRYDKIRLSGVIATPIIETSGFRVFKDKEKQELIRKIAEKRGVLIMTDVDSAGFVIRNFLRGIVPSEQIKHAYIPTVKGKERRKAQPSKEGVLGVEGIDKEALIEAIRNSGAHMINCHCEERYATRQSQPNSDSHCEKISEELQIFPSASEVPTFDAITKQDFYDYGLTGSANSAKYREAILQSLGLPKYLTANAMLAAINCLFTKEEFEQYLLQLNQDKD